MLGVAKTSGELVKIDAITSGKGEELLRRKGIAGEMVKNRKL